MDLFLIEMLDIDIVKILNCLDCEKSQMRKWLYLLYRV